MAGGPTTPDLIAAAAQAGAVGFVAAGYKTAQAMRGDIDAVTAMTSEPCGVNVFVPGAPADPDGVARYLDSIAADAAALGTEPGPASWDDDDWHAKIADLLARPVPIVSFTFGCPEPAIVSAFQAAGSSVWVTVTDPAEAAAAVSAGADCLCVQGAEAGAHRGTFTNAPGGTAGIVELIAAIRAVTSVALVAAGGIMDAGRVTAALAAGATAVQVRDRIPALPRKRRAPGVQGGARGSAVRRYCGHPRVQRLPGPGRGEQVLARPSGRASRLSGDQ